MKSLATKILLGCSRTCFDGQPGCYRRATWSTRKGKSQESRGPETNTAAAEFEACVRKNAKSLKRTAQDFQHRLNPECTKIHCPHDNRCSFPFVDVFVFLFLLWLLLSLRITSARSILKIFSSCTANLAEKIRLNVAPGSGRLHVAV